MMLRMKWKILLVTAFLIAGASILRSRTVSVHYTVKPMSASSPDNIKPTPTAIAMRLTDKVDGEGMPTRSAWEKAPAYLYDQDWKGENADAALATEVRILWTPERLFLRFHCNY